MIDRWPIYNPQCIRVVRGSISCSVSTLCRFSRFRNIWNWRSVFFARSKAYYCITIQSATMSTSWRNYGHCKSRGDREMWSGVFLKNSPRDFIRSTNKKCVFFPDTIPNIFIGNISTDFERRCHLFVTQNLFNAKGFRPLRFSRQDLAVTVNSNATPSWWKCDFSTLRLSSSFLQPDP